MLYFTFLRQGLSKNGAPAYKGGPMNKEKDIAPPKLQWHPAFYAGIQIELEKDASNLTFENEHQLGTKPKEIDVLIIKKDAETPIQTNLGKIFRRYNIVEYKSPTDYLSIDDFYKVYGYACFYKTDTVTVNEIPFEEITITFVCRRYPQKLMTHWKNVRGYHIVKQDDGIFYITGDVIPMQLIVTSLLSKEKNLWLSNLTDQLQDNSTAEKLIYEYEKHKNNELYRSVMDIIVRANKEKFEGGKGMCEAFFELNFVKAKMEDCRNEGLAQGITQGIAQGIAQGITQGITQGISQGISQGIKSLIEVCQELGLTASETAARLKDKFSITDESADAYLAQYWK